MAAASLNGPGTKYGPCIGQCEHKDCQESRAMASKVCDLCGKPIGYDAPFFEQRVWRGVIGGGMATEESRVLTHAACMYRSRT